MKTIQSNSTTYTASLYFNEDFLDFQVVNIGSFASELEAEKFANIDSQMLVLQENSLELVVNNKRFPIPRDNVIVKIDNNWHNRTGLDPRNPDFLHKIKQAMSDYEQGVANPLNVKEEELELCNLNFKELLALLNQYHLKINKEQKQEWKITQCIAYGVHEL
jgi:hypothetical protein